MHIASGGSSNQGYMAGWNQYHQENPKAPFPGRNVGAGIEQGIKDVGQSLTHPGKVIASAVAGAAAGFGKGLYQAAKVGDDNPTAVVYAAVRGAAGAIAASVGHSFAQGFAKGSTSWN